MINYKEFAHTEDVAYNIYKALLYCKKHKEDGIIFPKDTYHIYPEKASEAVYCISNHSDPGFKRCLFLLEELNNFTLDGGDSEFIFEDVMTPVIVSNSKNITLKNFTITFKRNLGASFEIIKSEGTTADIKPICGKAFVHSGELYEGVYEEDFNRLKFLSVRDENGRIPRGVAGDYYVAFNDDAKRTHFSYNPDGTIKASNLPTEVKSGQKLLCGCGKRNAALIFLNESVNTGIYNVTLHSGVGMGVIAQNCDTVSIDKLSVCPKAGFVGSINCDGTHFVHCKGKISITNSHFEAQGDDALNIHSIYFKIIDKTPDRLILKQVNREQKGIDIMHSGDEIEICNPQSLLPKTKHRVLEVKRVNLEITEVKIDGDTKDIEIGDIADEVSWVSDVLFENCNVVHNRARGMLLASAGKTVIRNNLFKTTGAAIKFESDGSFWYESGRTKDVIITENVFENCKYSASKDAIITVSPREKTEEGRYYHKKIAVTNNEFKGCNGVLASINNTETFIFKDNKITDHKYDVLITDHCKNVETD
ncbi:MAG: right-handed parallel beta-helix repeat-containing protein [Clostridia bacterium]|nr:right-handed parallel beta-helix repeat-containing protein [Clostridia bacterium]